MTTVLKTPTLLTSQFAELAEQHAELLERDPADGGALEHYADIGLSTEQFVQRFRDDVLTSEKYPPILRSEVLTLGRVFGVADPEANFEIFQNRYAGVESLLVTDLVIESTSQPEPLEELLGLKVLQVEGGSDDRASTARFFNRLWPGVGKLSELTKLTVEHPIEPADLAGFQAPPALETLQFRAAKLTAIPELPSCERLKCLDLSWNKIGSVSSVRGFEALSKLNLSRNPLKEVSGLDSLPNLKVLNLSYTLVSNLDFVRTLPQLTELDVGRGRTPQFGKPLKALDLAPLRDHPTLSELDFDARVLNADVLLTLPRLSTVRTDFIVLGQTELFGVLMKLKERGVVVGHHGGR